MRTTRTRFDRLTFPPTSGGEPRVEGVLSTHSPRSTLLRVQCEAAVPALLLSRRSEEPAEEAARPRLSKTKLFDDLRAGEITR